MVGCANIRRASVRSFEVKDGLPCFAWVHLDTTTRNFLPLPARNEWGEGWGEGHSITVASSPPPSPPLGEEREKTSASRMVVVSRCALPRRRLEKEFQPARHAIAVRFVAHETFLPPHRLLDQFDRVGRRHQPARVLVRQHG